jgi:hypothetical protein
LTPSTTKFYFGDQDNLTLKLPNFEGLFLENSVNNLLDKVNAGLPEIQGSFSFSLPGSFAQSNVHGYEGENAFSATIDSANIKRPQYSSESITSTSRIVMRASSSNSIYGNSSTVQPPAVKLLPIIKY